jgi:hypothetical protein
VIRKREEVVTDPIDIKASLSGRVGLSSNAIFGLWKAALKDDERLLDNAIAAVHDQMMLSDRVRAERVISMVIRRHRHANGAFKAMLGTMCGGGRGSKRFRSSYG